jgi:hypothetical protein
MNATRLSDRAFLASPQRCGAASYPERHSTKVQCGNLSEPVSNLKSKALMKNRKNYIAGSTATLTQSGLLAALLQHQRRKVIELSQRRAQREQVGGLLRNSLTWLLARYHNITAGRRFRRGFGGETVARHT